MIVFAVVVVLVMSGLIAWAVYLIKTEMAPSLVGVQPLAAGQGPSADQPVLARFASKKQDSAGQKGKVPASAPLPEKETLPNPSVSEAVSFQPPVPPAEPDNDARLEKLEQKCFRLEMLLEERNRMLEGSNGELESETCHRGEFEKLQKILNEQIDCLKSQNRKLKEDLELVIRSSSGAAAGSAIPLAGPAEPASGLKLADDFIRITPDAAVSGVSMPGDTAVPPDPQGVDLIPPPDPGKSGPSLMRDILKENNNNNL